MDQALERDDEVEGWIGADQVIDQPDGEAARRKPHVLLAVAVDHVVLAGLARLAGLASGDRATRLVLELEGDVFGDVAQPGALPHSLQEPPWTVERAAVLLEPWEEVDQGLVEGRQRVRGPGFERPEVHQQPDGGLVGPEVGTAQDLGFEDAQVGSIGRPGRSTRFLLFPLGPLARAGDAHSEALFSCRPGRRRRSGVRLSAPSAAIWRTRLRRRRWPVRTNSAARGSPAGISRRWARSKR